MNLTDNFTLDELCFSDYATRKGIDNRPPAIVQQNIALLAAGLERVRVILDCPMHITSGYRCAPLNLAIGGASNSAHVLGFAADFIAPEFGSPADIARAIADSDIKFDQLIQEGRWVHISFDPRMRHQVLTATFVNGRANYSEGIA